jgi:hypothetical protein
MLTAVKYNQRWHAVCLHCATARGWHQRLAAPTDFMQAAERLGIAKVGEPMPWSDAGVYALIGSLSIASANLSLLFNSVGFYQARMHETLVMC